MIEDWSRTAEQIMLSTVENNIRILAITSPAGRTGVSTVAQGLAAAFAQSGRKTVLIDLSATARHNAKAVAWSPDEPLRPELIHSGNDNLAVLAAAPPPAARPLFNNVAGLQTAFRRDFAQYETIIIDLPAVGAETTDAVNPIAVARAADAVFIVAPTGATARGDLTAVASQLRQVGAPLAGVIMNDRDCQTLGEAIAQVASTRLGANFPRAAHWIASKALASTYLSRNFRIAT